MLCVNPAQAEMGLFLSIWSTILFDDKLLSHWGRVTHICVSKLTSIGSDNGLSPDRHQAIIWTNAGILLIGPLGTNFSEISIEILTFSFKKMRLKVSSAKRRPFCLGLNVLTHCALGHSSLMFVPNSPTDYKSTWFGKSLFPHKWQAKLPEPMMTQFIAACMSHQFSMS